MKKQYKKPMAESVKVSLYNSLLEDIGVVNNSTEVSDSGLGKEQYDPFGGDADSFGDIWGTDEDPNDLWNE